MDQTQAKSSRPSPIRNGCRKCYDLWSFLRRKRRRSPKSSWPSITLVDLFCGTGGLTLGAEEAAFDHSHKVDIRLAMDLDPNVTKVYKANFPKAKVFEGSVEAHFTGRIGDSPSMKEAELSRKIGALDLLVGGPPCQGHSDLNNHSRRDDERNGLYARMARAAEVLHPKAVIIENVPTVRNDVKNVVSETILGLEGAGFATWHGVVDLSELGVPQTRRRHLILASRNGFFNPSKIVTQAIEVHSHVRPTTVRWATEDLLTANGNGIYNKASTFSDTNVERVDWLFDHDKYDLPNNLRPPCHQSEHSYASMYGRLDWDRPAQTVTTGFGSPGQGRYIHPMQRRTITPHEAARLQTFPDFFNFADATKRGVLAKMIGNAVPPIVSQTMCAQIIPLLTLA